MRHGIGVLSVALLVAIQPAAAATIRSFVSKEGKTIISINGEIVREDVATFKEAIRAANQSGKLVSGIRLNSEGGNLGAGVEIAEIVRFAKAATVVANGATCASACFLIFAAGSEKFASHSAQIGVHGASESGRETINSGAATVSMARVSKELGVSETIIGKMVVTPPDQMVWLSPNDLRSIGTTMTGKPVQTKEDGPSLAGNAPMQLSPDASATLPRSSAQLPKREPVTWNKLVETAIETSASQNNGKPNTARSCQPELKLCYTAIFLTGKSGKTVMLRKTEDMHGQTVAREFCEVNSMGDVRVCTDFDTNAKVRAMKDDKGNWYKVADE